MTEVVLINDWRGKNNFFVFQIMLILILFYLQVKYAHYVTFNTSEKKLLSSLLKMIDVYRGLIKAHWWEINVLYVIKALQASPSHLWTFVFTSLCLSQTENH